MNVLLVLALTALVLGIAARTYPFAIARRFNLNDGRPTPAVARADGSDFVASPTHVVFAHHFASIAGAGPIVGPVLALAFGWGWAWLWVVFGAIFFGAVQDMSAMCVSIREGGGTIAEVARRTPSDLGDVVRHLHRGDVQARARRRQHRLHQSVVPAEPVEAAGVEQLQPAGIEPRVLRAVRRQRRGRRGLVPGEQPRARYLEAYERITRKTFV